MEKIKQVLELEGVDIKALEESKDLDNYISMMVNRHMAEKGLTKYDLVNHMSGYYQNYKIKGLTPEMVDMFYKRPENQYIIARENWWMEG